VLPGLISGRALVKKKNTGCNRKLFFFFLGGGGEMPHTHFGRNLLSSDLNAAYISSSETHASLYQTTVQQPVFIITAIRILHLKLSITILLTYSM
jgi:hypothetical protein